MTDYYMDTDAGSDGDNGSTWALGFLTLKYAHTQMAAGDSLYVQGAAADAYTAAGNHTFLAAGTFKSPTRIIGCADGTTAEPPAAADFTTKSTGPTISTGASAGVMIFDGSATNWGMYVQGIQFDFTASSSRLDNNANGNISYVDCDFDFTTPNGTMNNQAGTNVEFIDCTIAVDYMFPTADGFFTMIGGQANFKNASFAIRNDGNTTQRYIGVDFSGGTPLNITTGGTNNDNTRLMNCRFPASWVLVRDAQTVNGSITAIGCNSTGTLAAASSYQDYEFEDIHGTIDDEATIVRTGGADDGATGAFSYAMAPKTSATLEGTCAFLASPWLRVWTAGGTNTFTVFITNGTGDLNKDEIWCEFLSPNSDDGSDHTLTFDPTVIARSEVSTTIVTDDTASTWVTHNTNKQKFSTGSITTGYTGWVYARVCYAKASGQTVYLDPRIIVT